MICVYQESEKIAKRKQKHSSKKHIYILLMRYPDVFSKFFGIISGGYYSHASIGTSGSEGVFYSYVKKGFRKELPTEHPTFKDKEVPCKLYCLDVSDEIYNVVQTILENHVNQAEQVKYSIWGVFLCLLRIGHKKENKYFCSQFVSEVLEQSKVLSLEKHSSLYLPDDFVKMKGLDLWFSGYLSEFANFSKSVVPISA